jgi:hypothetical protein
MTTNKTKYQYSFRLERPLKTAYFFNASTNKHNLRIARRRSGPHRVSTTPFREKTVPEESGAAKEIRGFGPLRSHRKALLPCRWA